MKSIIVAFSVLFGCSTAAQTVRPGTPDTPVFAPQLIQTEEITDFELVIYSDSITSAVETSSIPNAPKPTLPASIRGASILNFHSAGFKTFRSDRFNRLLVVTEFWSRGLDALSTYNALNNPSWCYREASRFFGMDMTPVFKNPVGACSYSLGVATAYSFVSTKFWNAGKNHPRHAEFLRRLSRSLLLGDSSMETITDIHNLSLMNR
jgi:hypothetical protein